MTENRSDVVVDHPECQREVGDTGVLSLLLDDYNAVVHVTSDPSLRVRLAGGGPPAQRLVALRGSVNVTDVDVVAGQSSKVSRSQR